MIKDKGLNVTVIEIDFAPHQPTEQTAIDGVTTYQVSHSEDDTVDNSRWMSTQGDIKGAIQVDASADEDQGHSIDSFNNSVDEIQKRIIK